MSYEKLGLEPHAHQELRRRAPFIITSSRFSHPGCSADIVVHETTNLLTFAGGVITMDGSWREDFRLIRRAYP
jgi:hypothetical protein